MSFALSLYRHPLARCLLYLAMCFLAVASLSSCSKKKTIVNGLDEKEANEILVFLASKGIEAAKVQQPAASGGAAKVVLWDISVGAESFTEAMALLNQSGLPRRRGQNLLQIFADTGLVPSELQQKIRYQAGIGEQIASTIRKIDGVLDAEVQISFPEEDPLNPNQEKKGKITASVYVKHSGVLDDPNSHLVTRIRRLVAASVTGLSFDNVTIIPDRARFGEVGFGGFERLGEQRPFVSIWSVNVAEESASRFRILFFTLSLIALALILALAWIGWKFYPVLQQHGGWKSLVANFHPIKPGDTESQKEGNGQEKPGQQRKDDDDEGVT